jgi:hypothetical protein
MANASVSLPPRRIEPDPPVRLDRLSDCVRRLDPATRALLDLSVRRGVRDDQMAPILRTDPFHLAWRRARALERVANEVGSGGRPAPLGDVRMALEALPREAWGLPGMGPPALPSPKPAGESAALVPVPEPEAAPSTDLAKPDAPRAGRLARLDAFASESPPMRLALRQLGRAMAAKAAWIVVWPRRVGR